MAKARDLAISLALAAAAYSGDAKAEVAQDMKELAKLLKEHGKPEFVMSMAPSATNKYCSSHELQCNKSYEIIFTDKDREFTLTYIDRLNHETGERDDSVNQDDQVIIEIKDTKISKPDMPNYFRKIFSDTGLDYMINSNGDYVEFRVNNPSKIEAVLAEKVRELYPKICFHTKYKGPSFSWWPSQSRKKKGTKQIEKMLRDQQRHYARKAAEYLRSRNSTQR